MGRPPRLDSHDDSLFDCVSVSRSPFAACERRLTSLLCAPEPMRSGPLAVLFDQLCQDSTVAKLQPQPSSPCPPLE